MHTTAGGQAAREGLVFPAGWYEYGRTLSLSLRLCLRHLELLPGENSRWYQAKPDFLVWVAILVRMQPEPFIASATATPYRPTRLFISPRPFNCRKVNLAIPGANPSGDKEESALSLRYSRREAVWGRRQKRRERSATQTLRKDVNCRHRRDFINFVTLGYGAGTVVYKWQVLEEVLKVVT
ncbi:hypothetical protein HYALB_00006561 [Hymenoscyphus albidus]|uniref:Uncharacterized protein n=1 Tax=Hymenoscyphus albidus TaxID=595503 RepID=A0A9N9QB27_9HELO|nr:hypothetical protein HYALB_00006561 [Hymenoscyphus albidus]